MSDLLAALAAASDPVATTKVLQDAIDAADGGGTVLVPPGTWTICTLYLRSGLTLHLERGAVLAAHSNLDDYPKGDTGHNKDRTGYHFIVAENCQGLTIQGDGTFDGRGEEFWEPPLRDLKAQGIDITEDLERMPAHWPEDGPFWRGWKPRISPMIELKCCQDVVLRDVQIINSPGWTVHPYCCDRVRIDGITIDNHIYGPNTDGIDVNGCRDVLINNCRIVGCDDNVILKATEDARTCERIAVTNCTLKTNCAALGLGAECESGIRDVTFSNCVVEQALRMIQFEMWSDGFIENVTITNISGKCMVPDEVPMEKVIYLDIQHHQRGPDSPLGKIRNVTIQNVVAETKGRIIAASAPGRMIENLTIRDVHLVHPYLEDMSELSKTTKGNQNTNDAPWARQCNAVVVAENVQGLWVENVRATLPAAGGDTPTWEGVALKNIDRGVIDCPWLQGNADDAEAIHMEDCTDVDVRAIGT